MELLVCTRVEWSGVEWSGPVTHDSSIASHVTSLIIHGAARTRVDWSGVELTRGVEWSGVDPSCVTAP
jgi:hypothetical protein